jgi:sulfate transport system permease protein
MHPPRERWVQRHAWTWFARAGKGLGVTYLSVIVLLPIAALTSHALDHGWGTFWGALTQRESLDAIKLTVLCAAAGTLINVVAGTATAWVLARDRFVGSSLLNALIDLPFALPTVVAGVTFYTLYGPRSPFHVNITGTWIGITVAIAFVTLPFNVRAVQPLLEARTFHAEAAAATLGASPARVLRTITLPALAPAIMTGAGLAFARALGEYGSVVFISNNLPYRSQVASSYVYSLATSGQVDTAAAVSVGLLVMALVILIAVNFIGRNTSASLS